MVTELSAQTGAVVTEPFRVQPTGEAQSDPSVRYLPADTLFVAWLSQHARGASGRLFSWGGRARFNAVSCDDGSFVLGSRVTDGLQGAVSSLWLDDRLMVFHPAQPVWEASGMGVVAWSVPWSELWPARR